MDEEVILKVEGRHFPAKKHVLCKHSDYFRVLFTGNFSDSEQHEVTLNIVDAPSIELILKYMDNNLNNLSEYPLEIIGNLFEAADFLLMKGLMKYIEWFLYSQKITAKNIFQLMAIAECFDNTDLLHYCANFAFYLPNISIQNIPSVQHLVWYLSQSQLYATNESDIFKFGFEWLSNSNTGVDSAALLMILGCLDFKRLTTKDLVVIRQIMSKFENSLAAKVVDCLTGLFFRTSIVSTVEIIARKQELTENFSELVYDEVLNLIKYNTDTSRKYEYTCVVPVTDVRSRVHYLHTFTNGVLEEWLKIDIPAQSNYWNIAAWGPKKLILVYFNNDNTGNTDKNRISIKALPIITRYGSPKGRPMFSSGRPMAEMMIIKAYDVGKKEWTEIDTKRLNHGTCRRVAVVGDSLYIICSSGHCLIYNLEQKECLDIAELPFQPVTWNDPDNPLICVHNDEVYVWDNKAAYKYDGRYDSWVKLIEYGNVTRFTNMVSHGEYIHVTDAEQGIVYRFKPDVDKTLNSTIRLDNLLSPLEINSKKMAFKSMFINSCSTGDELLIFILNGRMESMILNVENFNRPYENDNQLRITYTSLQFLRYETYRDACRLILTPRSINKDISEYLKKCLMRYDAGSQSASCSSLDVYFRQGLPQSKESSTENAFQSLDTEKIFVITQYLNSCDNFGFYWPNMKFENISSVQDFIWYLSQSQYYASNESEIFRLGFEWFSKTGVDSAALLMILGCLDVKRLTTTDLFEIKQTMTNFDNSFAAEVVNCLIEVSKNVVISTAEIIARKTMINEIFTKNVYDEVLNLVKYSRNRKYEYKCIIPVRDVMSGVPYLYTFTNEGLKKWLKLDITNRHLPYTDTWYIAAWGPKILLLLHITRLDLVYSFNIKAYDIVKKECTDVDRNFHSEMCLRIAVVRDSLYLICANGHNLVYDLRQKVFKNIAELPFKSSNIPAQMPPGVPAPNFPLSCVHDDEVYVSNCNSAYKYMELNDSWIKVIEYGNVTGLMSNMVSHGEHIYVTDALQRIIYRFKPGVDETLKSIITLGYEFCPIDSNSGTMECNSIINSCSTGDQLLFFTSRTMTDAERDQKIGILNVEEFNQSNDNDRQFKVVYTDTSTSLRFDQNKDVCKLVVTPPSIDEDISQYLKNCLMRYNDAARVARRELQFNGRKYSSRSATEQLK